LTEERVDFERDLRRLRGRAENELDRVEEERTRLRRLIAFIDGYGGQGEEVPAKRKPTRRPRGRRPTDLLEVVRERPGVRASMLAMVSGREVEDVVAELSEHERAGRVERNGLGWRTAGG
jgi:hypothetical protein